MHGNGVAVDDPDAAEPSVGYTASNAAASPHIGVNLGGAHIGSVGTMVGGDDDAGNTPPEETER